MVIFFFRRHPHVKTVYNRRVKAPAPAPAPHYPVHPTLEYGPAILHHQEY